MNILLVISLVILIVSLFGMYRIYQNASSNTLVDENYVIDIDQSIIDFLRNGGRNIKKTFGLFYDIHGFFYNKFIFIIILNRQFIF